MSQILGTLSAWAVYREPDEDADPAYRAYCQARLALPGVEEDASLHARLLMPDDFLRLINVRHHTDLRTERLNRQAEVGWLKHQARYAECLRRKAARDWHGPSVPVPGELHLRPLLTCSARTEQLFATAISEVITTGRAKGVFLGTDPWTRLVAGPLPAFREEKGRASSPVREYAQRRIDHPGLSATVSVGTGVTDDRAIRGFSFVRPDTRRIP